MDVLYEITRDKLGLSNITAKNIQKKGLIRPRLISATLSSDTLQLLYENDSSVGEASHVSLNGQPMQFLNKGYAVSIRFTNISTIIPKDFTSLAYSQQEQILKNVFDNADVQVGCDCPDSYWGGAQEDLADTPDPDASYFPFSGHPGNHVMSAKHQASGGKNVQNRTCKHVYNVINMIDSDLSNILKQLGSNSSQATSSIQVNADNNKPAVELEEPTQTAGTPDERTFSKGGIKTNKVDVVTDEETPPIEEVQSNSDQQPDPKMEITDTEAKEIDGNNSAEQGPNLAEPPVEEPTIAKPKDEEVEILDHDIEEDKGGKVLNESYDNYGFEDCASYWITPQGKIISIEDESHSMFLYNNPKVFGYTQKFIKDLFARNDDDEEEIDTISEIIITDDLMDKGWIKVRQAYAHDKETFRFFVKNLDNRKKNYIYDFATEVYEYFEDGSIKFEIFKIKKKWKDIKSGIETHPNITCRVGQIIRNFEVLNESKKLRESQELKYFIGEIEVRQKDQEWINKIKNLPILNAIEAAKLDGSSHMIASDELYRWFKTKKSEPKAVIKIPLEKNKEGGYESPEEPQNLIKKFRQQVEEKQQSGAIDFASYKEYFVYKDNIDIKDEFYKTSGFAVSLNGTCYILEGGHHHEELFSDIIASQYSDFKYDESQDDYSPLAVEQNYDEIMEFLYKKGWMRIRADGAGHIFVQLYQMRKKHQDLLYKFAQDCITKSWDRLNYITTEEDSGIELEEFENRDLVIIEDNSNKKIIKLSLKDISEDKLVSLNESILREQKSLIGDCTEVGQNGNLPWDDATELAQDLGYYSTLDDFDGDPEDSNYEEITIQEFKYDANWESLDKFGDQENFVFLRRYDHKIYVAYDYINDIHYFFA